MLCCQPQLPQRPWKELKLYFYAIFNLALMGIRQKRQVKNHAKLTSYTVSCIHLD